MYESVTPAEEDTEALNEMLALFRTFAAKDKRRLVTRLLQELSDEERAEVFKEAGR